MSSKPYPRGGQGAARQQRVSPESRALGELGSSGVPVALNVVPQRPPQVAPLDRPAPERDVTEILQALFSGLGLIRVKQTNGFFAQFPPRAQRVFAVTMTSLTVFAPGLQQTLVLGGFKVPNELVIIIRSLRFSANIMVGATEQAAQPGQLDPYFAFGATSNGTEVQANASLVLGLPANSPPGALFGIFQPDNEPAANPSNVLQAGVGDPLLPDQPVFVDPDSEFALIATAQAALPFPVTSQITHLNGIAIERSVLEKRLAVIT